MAMKMKRYEGTGKSTRRVYVYVGSSSNPKFVNPLLETILGVKIRKIVYPRNTENH